MSLKWKKTLFLSSWVLCSLRRGYCQINCSWTKKLWSYGFEPSQLPIIISGNINQHAYRFQHTLKCLPVNNRLFTSQLLFYLGVFLLLGFFYYYSPAVSTVIQFVPTEKKNAAFWFGSIARNGNSVSFIRLIALVIFKSQTPKNKYYKLKIQTLSFIKLYTLCCAGPLAFPTCQ